MAKSLVIFANVGTSILGNYQRALPDDSARAELKARLKEFNGLRPAKLEGSGHGLPGEDLVQEWAAWARAYGEEASAEIKSVLRIIASDSANHRVSALHLLVTDTVEGMLAARAVQRVLREEIDCPRVELHRIGGLQVKDGSDFVRFGLPTYIETLYELLRNYPKEGFRRIFNPTGGFKSVVPYLTLIAMLEDAETRYIFERSHDLLELRPLPISFDPELIARALPALNATHAAGSMMGVALEAELGLKEPLRRTAFASLWTTIDGEEFQVSGVGEILRQRNLTHDEAVYLSSAARADLADLDPDARRDVLVGLRKLRYPTLRNAGLHVAYSPEKSDCQCLGRKQTNYRIHFYTHQNSDESQIRVTRLFHTAQQHDERNRILDGPGIFQEDFGEWEHFTKFED